MMPHGVEVFVGLEPIDLRWGFERLVGVVSGRLGRAARSGAMFVFFGRRKQALKVCCNAGSGLCGFYKRLDKGTFRIPASHEDGATSLVIDEPLLEDLLDGIDFGATARH